MRGSAAPRMMTRKKSRARQKTEARSNMATLITTTLAIVAAGVLINLGTAYAAEEPQFKLGFKLLAEQIPREVGRPLEEEHPEANGDTVQRTTTGLMVWRKADNWTAFTDGYTTWVNGLEGLQSRLNGERFGWELRAPAADSGIDPGRVRLNTVGLPFPSYRVDRVAGTPYDTGSPPGPRGLPEHLRVGFGLIDQPDARHAPVMYIIPMEGYARLWEQNGNSSVARAIARIRELAQGIPSPAPIRSMPLLPHEESGGVNDLAVQIRAVTGGENSALGAGFRYVGRFAQDANPVTNDGRLRYIYQGSTRDGRYLVAFFSRAYTSALPDPRGVPLELHEKLASDYRGYMEGTAAMLNALPNSAWELDLDRLDAFVGSLHFVGEPDVESQS